MGVTMRDIAKETGLSVTAVSLVLNDRPNKISEASRKRIIETAERLRYSPNQLAVGLVKKHTNTIGLVLPDISNSFFSELALGVDAEAYEHGKNILLINTRMQAPRDLESLKVLAARGVDAILFCVSDGSLKGHLRALEKEIKQLDVPVVMVDRHEPRLYCSSVSLNNRQGAYVATEHLVSLGHRDILFITGPASLSNTQERLKGCRTALEEADLTLEDSAIYEGDYSHHSGREAATRVLENGYTAAFIFNDMMAFGLCQELLDKGYRIPEDISVVGFDDSYFSKLFQPPLTTVRQPAYDIGCAAVEVALEEIDNLSRTKKMISFEPELVTRKSTGPCKLRPL